MSKQTAVDVYHTHIRYLIGMGLQLSEPDRTLLNSAYKDCKAMEKTQIEDAWDKRCSHGVVSQTWHIERKNGEQYYNETYKGGEQLSKEQQHIIDKLKIEERELSLEERYDLIEEDKHTQFVTWQSLGTDRVKEVLDKLNVPTKLITITYNDKTIESYE